MVESVLRGPRHYFEIGVFGGKITLILLLLILSFINADTTFIQASPRAFLTESIVSGLSGAIPFYFIAMYRKVPPGDAATISVTAFLMLFLLNVVMEFSGMNKSSNLTASEQKQQNFLTAFTGSRVLIGIVAFVMLILALWVHDMSPGISIVFKEALIMGLAGALPTLLVAYDRKEPKATKYFMNFALMFVIFFIGHFVLQLGGFYAHIFERGLNEE